MGLFPRLAAANTFTANQVINKAAPTLGSAFRGVGNHSSALADGGSNGADLGPLVSVGRNSTTQATPAAGQVRIEATRDGQWVLASGRTTSGVLRIWTSIGSDLCANGHQRHGGWCANVQPRQPSTFLRA
jgi:hypothetical protein